MPFKLVLARLSTVAILSVSAAFGCCATTTEITITTSVRASITDEATLRPFRFGPGPGNFVSGIESTTGWIIADWLTPLPEPRASLLRYDVIFHISIHKGEPREKHANYLAQFVYDPTTGQGFIRLPAKGEPHYSANSTLLYRGPKYEGQWFAATPEWTAAADAALRQAAKEAYGPR